ncbi:hypothetical protein B484DRAFT_481212 [Ochromonadaceae sp. CCMP2298]|nr:hypothetical protein B484DRAFT_481212 [Ochromonadaceae sp. CCMP2298]
MIDLVVEGNLWDIMGTDPKWGSVAHTLCCGRDKMAQHSHFVEMKSAVKAATGHLSSVGEHSDFAEHDSDVQRSVKMTAWTAKVLDELKEGAGKGGIYKSGKWWNSNVVKKMLSAMENRRATVPQAGDQQEGSAAVDIAKKQGKKLQQDLEARTKKLMEEIKREEDDRVDIKETQSKMAVSVEKGTSVFEGIGANFAALVNLQRAKGGGVPTAPTDQGGWKDDIQAQVTILKSDMGDIKDALSVLLKRSDPK